MLGTRVVTGLPRTSRTARHCRTRTENPTTTKTKHDPKPKTEKSEKAESELKDEQLDEVAGGTRAGTAQSDVSAKYSQFHDGIAQNFK